MFVRRALLALVFGCLIGGNVPAVANAADDPGAIIASLGSKALAEIQKNNASRPLMEANFKTLLENYFDVPSISKFVLARYWRVATGGEGAAVNPVVLHIVVQYHARHL